MSLGFRGLGTMARINGLPLGILLMMKGGQKAQDQKTYCGAACSKRFLMTYHHGRGALRAPKP